MGEGGAGDNDSSGSDNGDVSLKRRGHSGETVGGHESGCGKDVGGSWWEW